jgi:hypothetical protein
MSKFLIINDYTKIILNNIVKFKKILKNLRKVNIFLSSQHKKITIWKKN